jgi:hypothetical protein
MASHKTKHHTNTCVIIYMYILIKLYSRYMIFALYLNIYLIAGVHIVKGECLMFSRTIRPEMYHFKAWFFLNIVCFACVLKFLCEQFYYRLNNKIDSTAEYLHETSKSTFLRHSLFFSVGRLWNVFMINIFARKSIFRVFMQV